MSTSPLDFTVVLVGVGNMGGAMLEGWLANGVAPQNITVIDPGADDTVVAGLHDKGVIVVAEPVGCLPPDVLLIAVKPQIMDKVLPGLRSLVGPHTVCVSVAAGKTINFMDEHLGNGPAGNIALVRAMPNTPALIGKGATIGFANAAVTPDQKANVSALLASSGFFDWVDDEALIDCVTALSGSGPAYVFHLAECMEAAGVAVGLPAELAAKLARQTIAGAGAMLDVRDEPAAQLRKNVTSPGGTTAAALSVLMEGDAMQTLMANAVEAARKRSQELS